MGRHTSVLTVRADSPEPTIIQRAADIIRSGGLVAFPTETVYGLGADALNPAAIREIFSAKGRPANNPLIAHVRDADHARELARDWPETAELLAGRFWPGPLTLVLTKHRRVPNELTAGGPTVALRCPDHRVASALIAASGTAIAAPSANRSGQLSPTRAEHVRAALDGAIDLILDAGPAVGGIESTVVDLTGPEPVLLRPGLVSIGGLAACVGPFRVGPTEGIDAPRRSPGLLERHYAPVTPLEARPSTGEALERHRQLLRDGVRSALLSFDDHPPGEENVFAIGSDVLLASARLYETLHRIDALGYEHAVVGPTPDGDEWLAIRDRIRRATAE